MVKNLCVEDNSYPDGLVISAFAYENLVADELELVHRFEFCLATVSVEIACRQ